MKTKYKDWNFLFSSESKCIGYFSCLEKAKIGDTAIVNCTKSVDGNLTVSPRERTVTAECVIIGLSNRIPYCYASSMLLGTKEYTISSFWRMAYHKNETQSMITKVPDFEDYKWGYWAVPEDIRIAKLIRKR